jgi:hypothetical protein
VRLGQTLGERGANRRPGLQCGSLGGRLPKGSLRSYERLDHIYERKSKNFYANLGPSSHSAQLARYRAGRLGVCVGGEEWVSLASDFAWLWLSASDMETLTILSASHVRADMEQSRLFRWNPGSRVKLTFKAVPQAPGGFTPCRG